MPDRIIRDELLESDRWLCLCSDSERLAFVGMILRCDDFGNLEGGLTRLFRFLSSFTQVKSPENLATMLSHLADQDLIRPYDVDGRGFIHIPRLRPHRQYLVRKFPPSPWCQADDKILGKAKRVINKGLAKSVATTLQQHSSDVAQGVGVGVGVGDNTRGGAPVDNFSAKVVGKHAPASRQNGKSNTDAKWWTSDESITEKGIEMGLEPRRGETMAEYKDRLFKAVEAAKRATA